MDHLLILARGRIQEAFAANSINNLLHLPDSKTWPKGSDDYGHAPIF